MNTRRILRAALLSLPMLALTAVLLSGGRIPPDLPHRLALAVTYAAFNFFFMLMLYTGKTDRWRAALYIPVAVLFAVSFMGHMLELFSAQPAVVDFMFREGTPLCPIVIPMTLIPAALTRTIIWPGTLTGSYASIASIFVIWLTGSLALGRGWCSWGCFFGGWDDAFSRVLPKPAFKAPAWLRNLPFAVLILFALLSAASLFPLYCALTCPVKSVTELPAGHFVNDALLFWVHLLIFFSLVIALPMLLKRRAQCAYFCPLGALQCGANHLTPFEVRVDTKTCSGCGTCVRNCPMLSITEETIAQGRSGLRCVKCGRCVDNCPGGAAHFHVKATGPGACKDTARLLFLYPAFLFMAAFGGTICVDALARLLLLASTGRMF